jgi:putative FmdB family regulatory protein
LRPADAIFQESLMPIYAYKCAACGHADDVLQKISADPLTTCPACGKASYAKQVTAAGFQLKGGGWYVTDFKGGNAPATQAKAEAPASDAKADAATGTKPEAAPAAKVEAATPASTSPAPTTPAPAAATAAS